MRRIVLFEAVAASEAGGSGLAMTRKALFARRGSPGLGRDNAAICTG